VGRVICDRLHARSAQQPAERSAKASIGIDDGDVSLDVKSYQWYYSIVSVAKVAVSIDDRLLRRLDSLVAREVFRSRSEAIQKAVAEKLARMDRGRLGRECAKLLSAEEQQLADEGMGRDASEWPEY